MNSLFAHSIVFAAVMLMGCGGADGSPSVLAPGPDAQAEAGHADSPDAEPETTAPDVQDQETGLDAGQEAEAAADVPDTAFPDAPDGSGQDTGSEAPPPKEICNNGADDDGDGLKDCSDPECADAVNCRPEICNGLDDDGNGIVDVDNPVFECSGTSDNVTPCNFNCNGLVIPGHRVCSATTCRWQACEKNATTEWHCHNSQDEDCDGLRDCLDPDCSSLPSCGAEICGNSIDDDVNDKTDCQDPSCASFAGCLCESPGIGTACPSCGAYSCDKDKRCGKDGLWHPSSDATAFACPSQIQEVCNGQDDDGDGVPDNGFPCVQNTTFYYCPTSCGSDGSRHCDMQCQPGACRAPVMEYNCDDGVDDDCDGLTDCLDDDCSSMPVCTIGPEICNGVDDDGNGVIDVDMPGNECTGTPDNYKTYAMLCGGSVVTGCLVCDPATCQWEDCPLPPVESDCGNAKDDDCDGLTDCLDPDCSYTVACPGPTQP